MSAQACQGKIHACGIKFREVILDTQVLGSGQKTKLGSIPGITTATCEEETNIFSVCVLDLYSSSILYLCLYIWWGVLREGREDIQREGKEEEGSKGV
jgi:hypothetical protein